MSTEVEPVGFGTFKGVYLPCIVTIIGVIVYLRLGWMVANVGLFGALFIIVLGMGISFLTVLSISAIATNMRVGGGGAYYIISRALGLEAGAAIGIPLYLSQVIGIAFYLAGFAETLRPYHQFPDWIISSLSLFVLGAISIFSTKLAMRMQVGILILLILSFISFFMGAAVFESKTIITSLDESINASFWEVFAVFFPGCTGIVAGISLSGELIDSKRSIPRGTMLSLLTGFLIFVAISVTLYVVVPREILLKDSLIMLKVASFPFVVVLGIWGATLSSALNNLVGAPRTVKALADDKVLSRWLGKVSGINKEPMIAALVTFSLAGSCIFLGDVNQLASILTMFFLTAFAALNLIAGLEGLFSNPSWRPSFYTPWQVSLLAFVLSIFSMLMINSGVAIIALCFCCFIYYHMRRRGVYAHWNDLRRSIYNFFAQSSIYQLEEFDEDPRTWRPHILVFAGAPMSRMYLIDFSESVSHGKGFLTVCTVVGSELSQEKTQSFQKSIHDFLAKRKITSLVKVVSNADYFETVKNMVNFYGLGKAMPNTFVFGETLEADKFLPFVSTIRFIQQAHKNILIVRGDHRDVVPLRLRSHSKRRIDIWWERGADSASFKLTIAYMLQNSQDWMGSRLVLKSLASSEEEKVGVKRNLEEFIAQSRTDIEVEVFLIDPNTNDFDDMRKSSGDADLVFVGMRAPDVDETDEGYADYYRQLLRDTHHFPELILCLKGEPIDFKKIFL